MIINIKFKKIFQRVSESYTQEHGKGNDYHTTDSYVMVRKHTHWRITINKIGFSFKSLSDKLEEIQKFIRNMSNEQRQLFDITYNSSITVAWSQLDDINSTEIFSICCPVSDDTVDFKEEEIFAQFQKDHWIFANYSQIQCQIKKNNRGYSVREYTADLVPDEANSEQEFYSWMLNDFIRFKIPNY